MWFFISIPKFALIGQYGVDIIAKIRFSIWRLSAILNLRNFGFVKFACSEWKFAPVYQIWSKSDNSRLRYGDNAVFKMAAVRHLELAKIAVLVIPCIGLWICIFSPNFALIGQYGAEILPKTIFNMTFVRHLEFAKFRFFIKRPSWELKCVSAYQIWSKSDNSRPRYGDKAIFKMAAVCHLEFAKIAVLVTCHIGMWSFISFTNLALIGQYAAEI